MAAQIPLGNQDQSRGQYINKHTSVPVDSEAWGAQRPVAVFQFNKITVLTSGGSIPPFEITTSRPTEHKVMGTGSKNFASGSLGIIAINATPCVPLDPWDLWILLWKREYYLLGAHFKHIQPPREHGLSLARYYLVAGTVMKSPEGRPTMWSMRLPRYDGKRGKTSEFYEHGPIAAFHWLIRNNHVWAAMMVDKAFCKCLDGSFGRSHAWRESTSVSE